MGAETIFTATLTITCNLCGRQAERTTHRSRVRPNIRPILHELQRLGWRTGYRDALCPPCRDKVRERASRFDRHRAENMLSLRARGCTLREIGEIFGGISRQAVYQALKKLEALQP
jgi:hypothetical protein